MPKTLTRRRVILWLLIVSMLCFLGWAFLFAFVSRDCGWQATTQAWVDSNENNKWDADELPLAGVSFHVNDIWNKYDDVAGPVSSNNKGEAQVFVWLPGCPITVFEIYANAPDGYRLTTQPRQVAFGEGPFKFRFIK